MLCFKHNTKQISIGKLNLYTNIHMHLLFHYITLYIHYINLSFCLMYFICFWFRHCFLVRKFLKIMKSNMFQFFTLFEKSLASSISLDLRQTRYNQYYLVPFAHIVCIACNGVVSTECFVNQNIKGTLKGERFLVCDIPRHVMIVLYAVKINVFVAIFRLEIVQPF